MTLRDAVEFISEAQFSLDSALGCTDGSDVKDYVESAIKPLEKALEVISEVANDIETAYLILKPNTEA